MRFDPRVVLGAGLWLTCCGGPVASTGVHGTFDTGTTYMGLAALAVSPPTESALTAGALLGQGYLPIGVVRTTAKLDDDARGPLRAAMAMQHGQLFTLLATNVPSDGVLRLEGAYCAAYLAAPLPGADQGGVAGIALGVMSLGNMQCARYEQMKLAVAVAVTESTALVWERRPDGRFHPAAWRAAVRRAIVDEHDEAVRRSSAATLVEGSVANGDAPTLAALVAAGVTLDESTKTRAAPLLHLAVAARDPGPVSVLASAGVPVAAADVYAAVDKNDDVMLAALVSPALPKETGRAVFLRAVASGFLGLIELSLGSGVGVDVTVDGKTALGLAATAGRADIVRLLLERGAKASAVLDVALVDTLAARCLCQAADRVAARGGRGTRCDAAARQKAVATADELSAELGRIAALPIPKNLITPVSERLDKACADIGGSGPGGSVLKVAALGGRIDWATRAAHASFDYGDLRGTSAGTFIVLSRVEKSSLPLAWALSSGTGVDVPYNGMTALRMVAVQLSGLLGAHGAGSAAARASVVRRFAYAEELEVQLLVALLKAGADARAVDTAPLLAGLATQLPSVAAALRTARQP